MAGVRKNVFTNLAVAALHMNDLAGGLKAGSGSGEVERRTDRRRVPQPASRPGDVATRACCSRRAPYWTPRNMRSPARKFASEAGTDLPESLAEIAEALVDVHSKRTDIGLTRLKRALNRARQGTHRRAGRRPSSHHLGVRARTAARHRTDVPARGAGLCARECASEQVLTTHLKHLRSFDHSVDDRVGRAGTASPRAARQSAQPGTAEGPDRGTRAGNGRGRVARRHHGRARLPSWLPQSSLLGKEHRARRRDVLLAAAGTRGCTTSASCRSPTRSC